MNSSESGRPRGRVMASRIEVGLYLFYLSAVLVMLAAYVLAPAPERWEFYRRSLAAWSGRQMP